MFHKQYYRLEEAAKQLGVDVETILSMEFDGALSLSYVHVPKSDDDYFINLAMQEDEEYNKKVGAAFLEKYNIQNLEDIENSLNEVVSDIEKTLAKSGDTVDTCYLREEIERVLGNNPTETFVLYLAFSKEEREVINNSNKGFVTAYELCKLPKPFFQRVIHDNGEVAITDFIMPSGKIGYVESCCYMPSNGLVVSHAELTRLKALKAQLDGKPTLEQLQAENEALKKQLDALSNSTSQTILQQREQALLFWVEGLGRDTVKAMSKPQIHEALKKIDRIFHFSDFDKFWQKQQVIKL